jgi:RHS repeat-associated protein
VYDNAGRLANVQRSSEATQQEFVYLGLAPVAMIETGKTCISTNTTANNPVACNTPKISHLWSDHLGTPRRATDAITNQIVWSWESTPFGETPAQDDPRSTGIKTNITLRFPGQQYDADTNLHYNQQRDYNPYTGRYVQADPIGLAGGTNVYGYVGGRPSSQADVSGTTTAYCIRTQTSFVPHGGLWINGVSRGFYPAETSSVTGDVAQSVLGVTIGTIGRWINEADPYSLSDCNGVDVPNGCDPGKFDACVLEATMPGKSQLYHAFLASCHNRAGQVLANCVALACAK